MTVVVNELDVVPADSGAPSQSPPPAAAAASPARAERMVEQTNRKHDERARRLRAY